MTNISYMQSRAVVVLAVVLYAMSAAGQDARARLEGTVREGSKPFSRALLIATDGESVWHTKIESNGEFQLFVPQGCYDLVLSSRHFHAKTKHLCVQAGEVKKLSFKVKTEFLTLSKQ